jgi:hypothetical protein
MSSMYRTIQRTKLKHEVKANRIRSFWRKRQLAKYCAKAPTKGLGVKAWFQRLIACKTKKANVEL